MSIVITTFAAWPAAAVRSLLVQRLQQGNLAADAEHFIPQDKVALMTLDRLAAATALGSALALVPNSALVAASPGSPLARTAKGVAGDFNGDGTPDLLWQNPETGALEVTLVNVDPSMARAQIRDSAGTLIAVGTDDFDGDRRTDILFWHPGEGVLVVWHMDGVGLKQRTTLGVGPGGYAPVSVLDYDGDGNPDILFQRWMDGDDLLVWLLHGTRVAGTAIPRLPWPRVIGRWSVVGAGDFDRDGDSDLVLYQGAPAVSTGRAPTAIVAIAFMDGDWGSIIVVTELKDQNCFVRSVADFSGDGRPDLLCQNTLSGDTFLWDIRGARIEAMRPAAWQVPRQGWAVAGPR